MLTAVAGVELGAVSEVHDALEGEVGMIDVDGRRIVPFELNGGCFDVAVGEAEVVDLAALRR